MENDNTCLTQDEKIKVEQEKKMDLLIDWGVRQINFQNETFNKIDQKVVWIFAIISASQVFLVNKYFMGQKYDFFETRDFLLTLLLILWTIILWLVLYIISWKRFSIWPWINKQKVKFWGQEKSLFDLKKDTLESLNDSIISNNVILLAKSRTFKFCIYWAYIYYFILVLYLIIYKIWMN